MAGADGGLIPMVEGAEHRDLLCPRRPHRKICLTPCTLDKAVCHKQMKGVPSLKVQILRDRRLPDMGWRCRGRDHAQGVFL